MNVIEVKNISKFFLVSTATPTLFKLCKRVISGGTDQKKLWALKDISFQVKKGDRVGIIGENGSGKTTLLRVISGLYRQAAGDVRVYGKMALLLRFGIGMERDLSVLDNIYLFGAILGIERGKLGKLIDKIVDFSELEDFVYSPLRNLSSGMTQRLVFSIIMEVDGDILLLDEMLAFGDLRFKEKCEKALESFHRSDRTFVVTSHDTEIIKRFCNNALLLEHGRQAAYGPVDEVLEIYTHRKLAESG